MKSAHFRRTKSMMVPILPQTLYPPACLQMQINSSTTKNHKERAPVIYICELRARVSSPETYTPLEALFFPQHWPYFSDVNQADSQHLQFSTFNVNPSKGKRDSLLFQSANVSQLILVSFSLWRSCSSAIRLGTASPVPKKIFRSLYAVVSYA